ncbi:MAG: hypothetical protein ACO4AI_02855 [Prochlorothrix sp.]
MIPTYFLAMVFFAMTLALGALWVFRQTDEDVYVVLAASIAVICFIVGFAHAPWAVQVGIGVGLLCLDRAYRWGWK